MSQASHSWTAAAVEDEFKFFVANAFASFTDPASQGRTELGVRWQAQRDTALKGWECREALRPRKSAVAASLCLRTPKVDRHGMSQRNHLWEACEICSVFGIEHFGGMPK